MTVSNGIKSKNRVKENGEVYTPDKIVNDMLDLVDEQLIQDIDMTTDEGKLQYIKKTYLEPACGDGQFLIRILFRKLQVVLSLQQFNKKQAIIMSLCSIYGVDIDTENVEESRMRMKALIRGFSVSTFGADKKDNNIKDKYLRLNWLSIQNEDFLHIIDYILHSNIVVGNTLQENTIEFNEYHWKDNQIAISRSIIGYDESICLTDSDYKNYESELLSRYKDNMNIDISTEIIDRYKNSDYFGEQVSQTNTSKIAKSTKKSNNSIQQFSRFI